MAGIVPFRATGCEGRMKGCAEQPQAKSAGMDPRWSAHVVSSSLLERLQAAADIVRGVFGVSVHTNDHLAASRADGRIQPHGGHLAGVIYHSELAPLLATRVQDFPGTVIADAIGNNHFPLDTVEVLTKQRVKECLDMASLVPARNDDGDCHMIWRSGIISQNARVTATDAANTSTDPLVLPRPSIFTESTVYLRGVMSTSAPAGLEP